MSAICLDDLLTVEELAQRLKVKVCTIRLWRIQRRIPFTRIGKRLYVSINDVEALLTLNRIPPAKGALKAPVGGGGTRACEEETTATAPRTQPRHRAAKNAVACTVQHANAIPLEDSR